MLLRPDSWLAINKAKIGGNVYIAVPECGIDGNAKVTNIEACPPIADGPGQVVIGTFHHHSATVYDLIVEGQDQSIGVTGNHPIWSADRQDYIPAAELSIGERLLAFNGTPRVKSLIPRGPPQSVYNLEVLNHHTYHVTRQGLLVHNSNPCAPDAPTRVGKFDVGPYNQMKGQVAGLDAHHAGQQAAMKKLVPGYDPATAPTILVPKVGHTIKGPNGIVSRSTKGLTNARDVIARDIRELRRVFPEVPNSKLQELIEMNKNLYPSVNK